MKHRHHDGFDQHDKAHIATDHHRGLGLAHAWSNQANEQAAVAPPWAAVPAILGPPPAGARETGDCSAAHMTAWEQRGIAPSSAVGRPPPHTPWAAAGAPPLAPPPEEASPLVKMADTRHPAIGHAMERVRQGTVAPVIGIIKAVLGCRPVSRRGLTAAAGEGCLVGVAFNLTRLPVL